VRQAKLRVRPAVGATGANPPAKGLGVANGLNGGPVKGAVAEHKLPLKMGPPSWPISEV